MIGATAKADQFMTRSGSDATKGSRTGRNLLGWGCDESLDVEQQRDALRLAVNKLNERFVEIKAEFLLTVDPQQIKQLRKERGEAVDRLMELNAELMRLNAIMKVSRGKNDVAAHIIDIFRERVTKGEWERIRAEARRRYDLGERVEGAE